MPDTTSELLTAKQLAVELRVNERRVYAMANAGRIPYYGVGERKRYVATEVLKALRHEPRIAAHTTTSDALRPLNVDDTAHLRIRTAVGL